MQRRGAAATTKQLNFKKKKKNVNGWRAAAPLALIHPASLGTDAASSVETTGGQSQITFHFSYFFLCFYFTLRRSRNNPSFFRCHVDFEARKGASIFNVLVEANTNINESKQAYAESSKPETWWSQFSVIFELLRHRKQLSCIAWLFFFLKNRTTKHQNN